MAGITSKTDTHTIWYCIATKIYLFVGPIKLYKSVNEHVYNVETVEMVGNDDDLCGLIHFRQMIPNEWHLLGGWRQITLFAPFKPTMVYNNIFSWKFLRIEILSGTFLVPENKGKRFLIIEICYRQSFVPLNASTVKCGRRWLFSLSRLLI